MSLQLQVTRFGGTDALQLREFPISPMLEHEVRIQVTAIGLNFADIMMRMGLYPEAPKIPFTPGYEIAGKVLEVGSKVNAFQPGDRVLGACRFGGYTTEVVMPAFQVRKIPKGITDEEAASIPVNFMTAWIALEELARVRKGDRVAIQSAAGGVGLAAVQIAVRAGAEVTGLVSAQAKASAILGFGAKKVLTYDFWNQEKNSDTTDFDIILDSTGGASLKLNFQRLAAGGRLINYGASSIVGGPKRSLKAILEFVYHTTFFTPYKLMMGNKGVFGLNLLQFFEGTPDSKKTRLLLHALDQVLAGFSDGSFKATVGKTFPLEKAGEAHNWLQSRSNIGKVVLIPTGTKNT